MRNNFISILALLLISGCSLQMDSLETAIAETSFVAEIEQPADTSATRTVLGGTSSNTSRQILWCPSDEIYVAAGGKSSKFVNTSATNSATATFGGSISVSDTYYAAYPYNFVTGFNSNKFSLTLPSVQTYKKDGFDDDSFPMVSKTGGSTFKFLNLCGIFVLNLTGSKSIESLVFSAKKDDGTSIPVAGPATVSMDYASVPSVSLTSTDFSTVTLECTSPVVLNASAPTSFHIILPPGTYPSFNIIVNATDGSKMQITSAKSMTVTRSNRTVASSLSYKELESYVDLGLSVKWATCNVGATKPEDYGGYYQWAGLQDVTSTSIYLDYSNCPYHTGSSSLIGWTKYVPSNPSSWLGSADSPDNKTVLDPEDDVAHVKLGGKWRMPTDVEWTELRNNCSWTWTSINGVNGYKVTGKKSGYTNKSIFLPAAGCRRGDYLGDAGSFGCYWCSSPLVFSPEGSPSGACRLLFYSGGVYSDGGYRCDGHSVRPVYGERVSVTGVSLSKTSLNLEVGGTSTLSATVTPSNAAEQSVSWSSSAPSVATVDASGKVTAVKAGSATITVTTTDGGYTATCAVKVKAALPANALPGVFSVSDTKQVHFSKGNLYYDGSNFNFEANQYGFNSSYQSTYVSHFYWSKDADEAVKQDFNWEQSMSAGDVFFTNVDGFKVNVGGKDQTGWRTLSTNEWQYLFNTRENANTKYGFATVGNVTGIILLPDTFTDPMKNGGSGAFVPKSTTGWTANTYTTGGNWEAMESAGAVFLPAAGLRDGSDVRNVGDFGLYWSSTAFDEFSAYCVNFGSSSVDPDDDVYRNSGCSVRLITESK